MVHSRQGSGSAQTVQVGQLMVLLHWADGCCIAAGSFVTHHLVLLVTILASIESAERLEAGLSSVGMLVA